MTITVPLLQNTLLANVRYRWIVSGIEQLTQSSGVSQPSLSFPLFRIILDVPSGAEDLLVFDATDVTNYANPDFELERVTI